MLLQFPPVYSRKKFHQSVFGVVRFVSYLSLNLSIPTCRESCPNICPIPPKNCLSRQMCRLLDEGGWTCVLLWVCQRYLTSTIVGRSHFLGTQEQSQNVAGELTPPFSPYSLLKHCNKNPGGLRLYGQHLLFCATCTACVLLFTPRWVAMQ